MVLNYTNNLFIFSVFYAGSTLLAVLWDFATILELKKRKLNSTNDKFWKATITWMKFDSILFGGSLALIIGIFYSWYPILFLFSAGLIILIVIDYGSNPDFFFPWNREKAV